MERLFKAMLSPGPESADVVRTFLSGDVESILKQINVAKESAELAKEGADDALTALEEMEAIMGRGGPEAASE